MIISYCDAHNNFSECELPEQGGIIGYSENNFIVLDELGVSSRHMRLSAVADRLFVEDLKSLNGTFFNGNPIAEKTEVKSGDSVLVGMILLNFEKTQYNWSVTAVRQDSSLFEIEESEPWFDTEVSEESATAVTVIASNDVKAAIQANNIEELLLRTPSKPPEIVLPPSGMAFPDLLQELGKYKIIKKIGKGGMGVVFLAKHKVMNTYRALKVMPHSVKEENFDFYERFMREARIASEIRHPNIVGVMDAETDPEQGVSYIVMEFIDGGTLRRILKLQNVLPEIQALLIVRSVAEALKAIAEHKIVHRDIKPDNIMFTRYGDVKLADLGIAKNEDDDVNLTRNDIMIGTPAYLSPEQIENPKDVDIRSDIYCLGATLYEMLTGSTPYAGKNTYDILQKMIAESIENPRRKNPRVSAVTARIVMKMLQKNPDKRYQTPQELLDALDEILPRIQQPEAQSIIQSAVLGTEYPSGAKKQVASGVRAWWGFIFFSCRQRMSRKASVSGRSKRQTDDLGINAGRYFAFQLASEAEGEKPVDFTISVTPEESCLVTASDGTVRELQADAEGRLELKNVKPGEYRITRQKTEEL